MTGPPSIVPFELVTERLRVRDYEAAVLEAVHWITTDPITVEHLPFGPNECSDTEAFIRRVMASAKEVPRRSYEVALTDRASGELVGGIRLGIRSDVHRDGSLGYILRRDLWGRGLVAEAARALLALGFGDLGLHRIWATCAVQNIARRVLEKLGMTRGHFREHLWMKGRWRNSYLYAVLEREWVRERQPAVRGQRGPRRTGRSRVLRPDEVESLLGRDVPARLATLDADGYPRVVPIWFLWSDGAFHMTSVLERIHVADIRRTPRAAICIDLEDRETRRNVQTRGRGIAELLPDHAEWTRRTTRKYVSGPDAESEADRRAAMLRVHIRLRPERLLAIGTPERVG